MIDSDLLPITRKQRVHMSVIYNMCSIGCIGLYFMYNAVDWLVVANINGVWYNYRIQPPSKELLCQPQIPSTTVSI